MKNAGGRRNAGMGWTEGVLGRRGGSAWLSLPLREIKKIPWAILNIRRTFELSQGGKKRVVSKLKILLEI